MQPGDILSGRYRLLHLIEIGGMGEVWAARNELTQRSFAIKFLLPALASRPDALDRFVREAETAGGLSHPSIVDVYDVALSEDGRPYIVMELLSGESLEARLERDGTLAPLCTAAYIAQIAQALSLAHAAGVVHRDLTAANIFIARNPDGGAAIPKILDFGVSKTLGQTGPAHNRTADGAILGSPEYMSPEQARGAEGVDHRTDIWSLGVVLYECLSGTVPFREKNYNALILSILTRPHRPLLELAPNADPELVATVEACLSKDRAARIQSASELAERLALIARRLSVGSADAGVMPRRRATDRLDAAPSGGGLLKKLPSLRERLPRSRPAPLGVAVVSALAGAVIGATAATCTAVLLLGAGNEPIDGSSAAQHAPLASEAPAPALAAEPSASRGSEAPPRTQLADLPLVVARSVPPRAAAKKRAP